MSAFVDTNVLIRHLTGDPPELAARATRYLGAADVLLLPDLILAEVAGLQVAARPLWAGIDTRTPALGVDRLGRRRSREAVTRVRSILDLVRRVRASLVSSIGDVAFGIEDGAVSVCRPRLRSGGKHE